MYIIDFVSAGQTDRRHIPCGCYGDDPRCFMCGGSGNYAVSMTMHGVLISERLGSQLIGELRLKPNAMEFWAQRLRAAVAATVLMAAVGPHDDQLLLEECRLLDPTLGRLLAVATYREELLHIREVVPG